MMIRGVNRFGSHDSGGHIFSGTWSITYRYDPSDTIKVTKSTDARPARSKPPKQ